MKYILEGLLIFIGFGSILFLAYITTRYIAGKSSVAMKGRYINIVETVSLGMDKRIHLVKVDKQFILIASTSKNIEFLTAVELEDLDKGEEAPKITAFNFKSLLEKYIQGYKGKKGSSSEPYNSGHSAAKDGVETFKSNLDKLKMITREVDRQPLDDKDDVTNEK